jgi:hypothetical protein
MVTGRKYVRHAMINGNTVKLSEADAMEIHYAALWCIEHGGNPRYNAGHYNKGLTWHESVAEFAESLSAELVVARYFNLPIDLYASKYKIQADVGEIIEVKWTHWHDGQLIIHEYDRDQDIAILVTGQYPYYTIRGWIPVAMAKKDKYRHHGQPNWWINQRNLMPIDTLIRSNYGQAIARMS